MPTLPRVPLLACLGMAVALTVSTSARASNPRITLQLNDATGPEVARALSESSGVPIEWEPERKGGETPERASFQWKEVPLSTVLSDVATRFHRGVGSRGFEDGFRLASDDRWIPQASQVGLVEFNGYRISIASVRVEERKSIELAARGVRSEPGLTLRIVVEVPGQDADALASIEHVTARDDRGRQLTQRDFRQTVTLLRVKPDQAQCTVTLDGWKPDARRLVSVSGELLVYQHFRTESVSIALPLPSGPLHKQLCDRTVTLVRLTPPEGAAGESSHLDARVHADPGQDPPGAARNDQLSATLFLRNGAPVRSSDFQFGAPQGRDGTEHHVDQTYLPLPEPAARVVLRFRVPGEPEVALNFRMLDIPLPWEGTPKPLLATSAYDGAPAGITDGKALEEPRGGTLTGNVIVAAPWLTGAEVQYGLSVVSPGAPTPTVWHAVPVAADGSASWASLKPGRYRVLRVLRVPEPDRFPASGHWRNSEVTVQVDAGRNTVLPPLVWDPGPEPQAAQRRSAGSSAPAVSTRKPASGGSR